MINDKEFIKFEGGFFKPYFEKYIEYKRGKGEKVAKSTLIRLRKLNTVLNQCQSECISQSMIEEILAPHSGLSESGRQYIVSDLRQFSAFINTLGIESAYVPQRFMRTVRSEFRPYIFSDEEIFRLVYSADHLPTARRTSNHQDIYPVLVRILIGTGMRIGEALALNVSDVDADQGIIRVVNGKNGVSRYIPVSESLHKILKIYVSRIDITNNTTPLFASPYTGKHYTYDAMKFMFPKMFRMAGIYRSDGRTPNIHSLRHTFCTKSLSQMISSGMDIYTAVPVLAAYVGHVNFADTERYIHFTEQDHEGFINQESCLGTLIPEVDDE